MQTPHRDFFTSIHASSIGPIGIRTTNNIVTHISILPIETATKPGSAASYDNQVISEIKAYLNNPNFTFTIRTAPAVTPFQLRVLNALRTLEPGKPITYGELAARLNSHPRAIGQACRHNPIPIIIPCHRVVAQNHLGGYAGDLNGYLYKTKKWLLKHENCIKIEQP